MKFNPKYEKLLSGACSAMTLTSKSGRHYWFRTCDIDVDIWNAGAHVIHKRAGEWIEYGNGKREIGLYSFLGMTYNSLDTWLLDGVNQHGLTGGLLMLYEGTSVEKEAQGKEGYIGLELVTKVLASCKSVEEVKELAKQVQVLDIPFENNPVTAYVHYFFVDCSGNEVILEATQKENPGVFHIYEKEELLGVMTNSPSYERQRENLRWFLSQSPEMKQGIAGKAITELLCDGRRITADEQANHCSLSGIFPASYCSYDRFIRLSILKAINDSGNGFEDKKMLALGSGIMNAVCEPHTKGIFHYTKMEETGEIIGQKDSYTQYLSMYDLEERCFYMKKYDETEWIKYQ